MALFGKPKRPDFIRDWEEVQEEKRIRERNRKNREAHDIIGLLPVDNPLTYPTIKNAYVYQDRHNRVCIILESGGFICAEKYYFDGDTAPFSD